MEPKVDSNKLIFPSEHLGVIHDIQYNFFGNKLATCGSEGKIVIYDIFQDRFIKNYELVKHESSIWKICWSHPRFGNIIASCGFDKKVLIWKELSKSKWEIIFEYNHTQSVNYLEFAPHDLGLILVTVSSDCSISVHEYDVQTANFFTTKKEKAHSSIINAVSWGSSFNISFHEETNKEFDDKSRCARFCTVGNDNKAKIWKYEGMGGKILEDGELPNCHTNWIRDVAWLKFIGSQFDTISTCGEDSMLFIFQKKDGNWEKVFEKKFDNPTLTVSWSNCGSYLACSCSDNIIYIFTENISSKWEMIKKVDDNGNLISDIF